MVLADSQMEWLQGWLEREGFTVKEGWTISEALDLLDGTE
jgi:hypothetical protein